MEYYKLRIDSDNLEEVVKLISKYSDNWLCSIENEGTENVHTHSYIETYQKEATIRNAIRKSYGSGNGTYSMKELTEEKPIEYLAYCVKEKKYKHNLNQELVDKALEYDLKIKKDMKEKKENRKTILQRIEQKYFNNVVDGVLDGVYLGIETVLDKVIEFYKEEGILIREFQLVSLCQTLGLKYVNSYDRNIKRKILEKI